MTADNLEKVSYTYSQQTGQLASVSAEGGIVVDTRYNGPFVEQMTWKGVEGEMGSVRQVLDDDFRVDRIEVNGDGAVDYSYDADGLVVAAGELEVRRDSDNGVVKGTMLDNIATTISTNGFGEYQTIETNHGDTLLYSEQVIERDSAGRILSRSEEIEGESHNHTYSYDTAGRLSSVMKDGATAAEYQYDSNGNRLRRQSPSGIEEGSYDQQDRLVRYGTRDYRFNDSGQLESVTDTSTNSTTRYRYDVFGNLRTVDLPDGHEITYEIDGFNRRVGKRNDETISFRLLYQDDFRPIALLDGNNAVVATFIYATQAHVPDYMVRDGITYRILTDHLGSVRLVVSANDGTVAQRIDYDEYGRVVTDTDPGFQPFGFAGGLYDADTGLVRFGARDYDAYTGRWTARDPILFAGGDANLYGYVIGDPVNLIDPNGMWLVQTAGGLFGAGAQAWTNYSAYACGRISGADYAASIGVGLVVGVLATLPTGIIGGAAAGAAGSGFNQLFNVGIGAKDASISEFGQAVALGSLSGGAASGLGKLGRQFLRNEGVVGRSLPLAPPSNFGELGGATGTGIGTTASIFVSK